MILKSESHYAVRAIRALYRSDKEVLTAKEIAEIENISKDFLYSILKKLNEKGIVSVIRGVKGGYKLTDKINSLTLNDVIFMLEGNIKLSFCCEDRKMCNKIDECKVSKAFNKIEASVKEELSKAKIIDLL